jgi:hypothetical protein
VKAPAPIRPSRSTSSTPEAYFRFVDDARKLGIDTPIVPGIMPITSSTQLLRFSDACGAEIPRWIRLRLQAFGDDTASIKAFGLDVVTDLCARLRDGGAPGAALLHDEPVGGDAGPAGAPRLRGAAAGAASSLRRGLRFALVAGTCALAGCAMPPATDAEGGNG